MRFQAHPVKGRGSQFFITGYRNAVTCFYLLGDGFFGIVMKSRFLTLKERMVKSMETSMIMMKPTVSIIVLAYNERENLEPTIANILNAVGDLFLDYEILIVDCVRSDGTDDGTRAIAMRLAMEHPKIRSIQKPSAAIGLKYWDGVRAARFEYVTFLPGDNETTPETIREIFRSVGRADVVATYTANMGVRPFSRRVISRLYTLIMNTMFWMRLRYFNGPSILKASLLKSLPPHAKQNGSFSFNAENLIRLIKGGASFVEIPMYLYPQLNRKTKALNFKNLFSIMNHIWRLFWEIQVLRRR